MRPEFGNAELAGSPTRGWFVGHFVKQRSLRATEAIEIKWGLHDAGERSPWKSQRGKKAVTLLLAGKFVVQVRSGRRTETFTLRSLGDFVVWEDDSEHRWEAITNAVIITVRWPSVVDAPVSHRFESRTPKRNPKRVKRRAAATT
jgi:quercetin dioxygenase-like cupin family protein